jgi:N,N-dimethylformamidase
MDIVGYGDRLSVMPGDVIRFMVSTAAPTYEVAIVRLIHGDTNPAGPGFKEEVLRMPVDGTYAGREQPYRAGSHALVPDSPALRRTASLTLQAWIYPTTPTKGLQGLLTKWSAPHQAGYGLVLDEAGDLALWLGDGHGRVARLRTGRPLRAAAWYFVAATYDAPSGAVRLYQQPVVAWPLDASACVVEHGTDVRPGAGDAPFIMAGYDGNAHTGQPLVAGHFNGKIDSPRLFGQALSRESLDALQAGAAPRDVAADSVIATWDFAVRISSTTVHDVSPQALHGVTVNMPMRAATGRNWSGRETDFRLAAAEYGAIHFHDDDLDDARWEVDFELAVPPDLRSGVYAARLRTDTGEDYVPFFVRPRPGAASAPIAVLLPTLSYLAYGNEHITWRNPASPVSFNVLDYLQPQDYYVLEQRLLSLYDHHSDDSGVCYASRLRPLLNMRPKYHMALLRGPHQFNADLHLTDWLEVKGFSFDVITDEDLHVERTALLAPYHVVLTGSHPEYWTGQMLDALEAYLAKGGRLMYLGGNGFYWITSIDPTQPHIIEVRRGQMGTGTWRSAAGENHHSATGELGGLWRHRGRAPQWLVGVGMAAQGFDVALPYRRQEGSADPRAGFIFEGCDEHAGIGDGGLVMNGAAGLEVDRLDHALGTPPHALLVASATGFSDSYQHVVEEVEASDSKQGGSVNPRVRADMVYFEGPNGGAVFSVGSITWSGCLSHNGYRNNVSQITENVLRAFAADKDSGQ